LSTVFTMEIAATVDVGVVVAVVPKNLLRMINWRLVRVARRSRSPSAFVLRRASFDGMSSNSCPLYEKKSAVVLAGTKSWSLYIGVAHSLEEVAMDSCP
jgi:hypothetical protein